MRRGAALEALYRVALSLGLRRGEVLALRWDDINFDRQQLTISGAVRRVRGVLRRRTPKTDASSRTLPVPAILLNVLRQHRTRQDVLRQNDNSQEHGLVFPSRIGTLIEPGNLHRQFKAVLKRAGLPTTIRFHDLRHSCATFLLAQGMPLVVVRDTLGHTQISTTANIYGHVLLESQRQAVDRIEALLGGDADVDVPPAEPEDD
jgi:integrase